MKQFTGTVEPNLQNFGRGEKFFGKNPKLRGEFPGNALFAPIFARKADFTPKEGSSSDEIGFF